MSQQINELEHKLWLLRGEVNQAMQNYENNSMDIDRLNYMDFEIRKLQERIAMLRGMEVLRTENEEIRQTLTENKETLPTPTGNEDVLPIRTENKETIPTHTENENIQQIPTGNENLQPNKNIYIPQNPVQNKPSATRNLAQVTNKKDKNLEKVLGTGIMGIMASILIFISIVIFGGLLIPYLSDGIMVFLMFLLSFALLGTGLFLLQKNNTNKFYLSLCACGASAICVSLLVTRIYFQLLNDMGLLFLISAWLAGMAYLYHKYNTLFQIIGEAGVFIAVTTGIVQIHLQDKCDWFSFIVLILVFSASMFLFDIFKRLLPENKNFYEHNFISHIIRTIAMMIFSTPFLHFELDVLGLVALFIFAVYYFVETYFSYKEETKIGILFYIQSVINLITLNTVLAIYLDMNVAMLLFYTSIFMIIMFHCKKTDYSFIADILSSMVFICASMGYFHKDAYFCVFCTIPLFLYGHFTKKQTFLYSGLVSMMGIFPYIWSNDMNFTSFILLFILPFLCFMYVAREEHNQIFTCIGYPLYLAIVSAGLHDRIYDFEEITYLETSIIVFLIIAVFNLCVMKFPVILNEERKGFEIILSLINGTLMCYSMSYIQEKYLTVPIILVMILLFIINSKRLLQKSEKWGYYIAFKYTVLMLCIISTQWEMAILYSIFMLLFALASITAGFVWNHKSFRIYGLILSMISVFKLILFDVDEKSMAYNAIGFLICGLICFGISFVYNKIEDKLKTENGIHEENTTNNSIQNTEQTNNTGN